MTSVPWHAADACAGERYCALARAAAEAGDHETADHCRERAMHAFDRAEVVLDICKEGKDKANLQYTKREEQNDEHS